MPMPQKNLTVSVPHTLGREAARQRLIGGIASLRGEYASKLASVDEHWAGDHLDFTLVAMGQTVRGFLDVKDEAVNIQVSLPWMLATFGQKILGQVRTQTDRLLSAPDATSKRTG